MTGFTVKHPDSNTDIEQIYMILNEAFPAEPVDGIVRRFIEHHPDMGPMNHFIVNHGDEPAAYLCLIPETWVLDGVELRVAEMGCVGTRPKYRRMGLQRVLNDRFNQAAKEGGFDLCVLAGIPYFYRQFGFEYAVTLDESATLELSGAVEPSRLQTRPMELGDVSEAQAMLEASQCRLMVHSLRTRGVWKMQLETGTYGGEPCESIAVLDAGKLAAYMRISQGEGVLVLKELGVSSLSLFKPVFSLLHGIAAERGLTRLVNRVSSHDGFSGYLDQMGATRSRPYAWQVKLVDFQRVFMKLKPLLVSRVRNSEHAGLTEALNLNFRKFNIRLEWADGELTGVKKSLDCSDRSIGLNPYVFPQLLLGYRSRQEMEHMYPDFRVKPEYAGLIDTLFPKGAGYIHYCY